MKVMNDIETLIQYFACDTCGAQRDESCVTFTGNKAATSHHARWRTCVREGVLPMIILPDGKIVHTDVAQLILSNKAAPLNITA
jgi:hypothetical protein